MVRLKIRLRCCLLSTLMSLTQSKGWFYNRANKSKKKKKPNRHCFYNTVAVEIDETGIIES